MWDGPGSSPILCFLGTDVFSEGCNPKIVNSSRCIRTSYIKISSNLGPAKKEDTEASNTNSTFFEVYLTFPCFSSSLLSSLFSLFLFPASRSMRACVVQPLNCWLLLARSSLVALG